MLECVCDIGVFNNIKVQFNTRTFESFLLYKIYINSTRRMKLCMATLIYNHGHLWLTIIKYSIYQRN